MAEEPHASRAKRPDIVLRAQKPIRIIRRLGVTAGVLTLVGLLISYIAGSIGGSSDHKETARYESAPRNKETDHITPAVAKQPKDNTLRLEPGVWYNLKTEGLLLPNQPSFKWNAFGCIEVKINRSVPKLTCEPGAKPSLPLSPETEDSGQRLDGVENITDFEIRSVSETVSVLVVSYD